MIRTISQLLDLSAGELAAAVRSKTITAAEVTDAHLTAAEARRDLNAFITLTADRARRRAGTLRTGALVGVPIAVKDLIEVRGIRTTYGSALFASHVSTFTASAVRRAEDAGATVVGKTNLHEFAWGLTSQNEHWGDVHNPTFPGYTPGGSSGGSAAAVAARLATIGLGTDTGGSIRVPAAACRLVGYMPSHGRIPMHGVLPLAPSFDTVGPIARSVADCVISAEVLSGEPLRSRSVRGLRAGVIEEPPAAQALEAMGLHLEPIILPEPTLDLGICFMAECAFTHRETYPRLASLYGRSARAKWATANEVRASDYLAARLALRRWRQHIRTLPVDLLVSRTLGTPLPEADVDEAAIRARFGRHTRIANFLGWASLAYGDLMISGPDDATVLSVGQALEEARVPLPEPIFDRV